MINDNQSRLLDYLGERANGVVSRRLSPVKNRHDSERAYLPKNPLSVQKQLEILKGKRHNQENASDVESQNGYQIDSDDGRSLRNMLKRQQESHKHHIDRIRYSQISSGLSQNKDVHYEKHLDFLELMR